LRLCRPVQIKVEKFTQLPQTGSVPSKEKTLWSPWTPAQPVTENQRRWYLWGTDACDVVVMRCGSGWGCGREQLCCCLLSAT